MSIRKGFVVGVSAVALMLAACGTEQSEEPAAPEATEGAEETDAPDDAEGEAGGTVTLVTHDSFYLPDGVLEQFTEESGYDVVLVAPGDAGQLTNQLILTIDSPLGDAAFGIDNSFASRGVDAGVFEQYVSADAPAGIDDFGGHLTAIDQGEVCLNVDLEWFDAEGIAVPETFEDILEPEYADLTVVTNPASSSPGMAFLLATVGHFGEDGWLDYWTELQGNGLRVSEGWSDAYYVDFSGSEGDGPRPIVLSYSSSPAAELNDDGEPRTAAMDTTCFRQVEYAGVIAGAENAAGAQALVDFLLTDAVQSQIAEAMWMYPVDEAYTPEDWAEFAPLSENPVELDPELISENRNEWLEEWLEAIG